MVIGAGAGMGEATAIQLAIEGASVVAMDIFPDRLDRLIGRLKEADANPEGSIVTYTGDVRVPDDIMGAAAFVKEKFGTLDVLCYVAGIIDNFYTPDNLDEEMWDNVMDINLKGAWRSVKAAAPLMVNHEGEPASIVIVTSVGGSNVYTSSGTAYIASKGGAEAMMRNFAFKYARENVRVNCVAPGSTSTEISDSFSRLFPEREMYARDNVYLANGVMKMFKYPDQMCSAQDMADAICFFSSSEAKHITGVSLKVDGGWSTF